MFVAELSGSLRLWSTTNVRLIKDFGYVHEGECSALACDNSGEYVYTAGGLGSLRKWEIQGRKAKCLFTNDFAHENKIKSIFYVE